MIKKFLIGCCVLALSGCNLTPAQITSANTTATTYQQSVTAACNLAEGLATVGSVIPAVASAGVLTHAACDTEEAVAKIALDPTTVAWLNTLITTMKSNGNVVPPPPVVNP